MIKRCVNMDNVEVDTYNGLLVNYARQHDAVAIVKGLRAVSDFDYEFQQALTNKSLYPEIETVSSPQGERICSFPPAWLKRFAASAGRFTVCSKRNFR